jgi:hypothetical protein
MFSLDVALYMCLKGGFNCRNNASEEAIHQKITKSAKVARIGNRRRLLPSSFLTIRVHP